MRPALARVVELRSFGAWPTALEVGAMLFEAGCDQAEAQVLVAGYADARPDHRGDAEAEAVALLQSFRLRPG